MNNPTKVKVNNKIYKINTDYRVALKCNQIATDETINDYEKTLAIIYLLYGDEGLECDDYEKLMELTMEYFNCNQDEQKNSKEDMSYEQDMWLIEASFRSCYGIDLSKEKMHFWDFFKYLNGLDENCVLNRIRQLRNYDTSKLKGKEKSEIEEEKNYWAIKKEKHYTKEQIQSMENFYSQIERK